MEFVKSVPIIFVLIAIGIVLIICAVSALIIRSVFRSRKNEDPTNNQIPVVNIPRPVEKKIKRCPVCESTFTDQSLKYCLSDGTLLEGGSDEVETAVRRIS